MISSLYLHSRSHAQALRVGVMVNGFELSRALRQVLEDIQASDFARLELVVVNRNPQLVSPPRPSGIPRYLRLLSNPHRKQLLFKLYQKFDQRHAGRPNPLEMVDCSDLLGSLARMDVVPVTKRFVHRFPEEATAKLRSYDLDVILRFGFNILRGEVLRSARYGIWSYHHGDNNFYRGGPALFWEVVENNPCSGVILQVLTEKLDDGYVLCKSLFSTARGFWRNSNCFFPYWGSTHFVIRKLHELHEGGWEAVKRRAVPPAPYEGKTEIYRAPTNLQMVKWLAPKIAKRLINHPFQGDHVHHWRICLRHADSPRMLAAASPQWSDFRWISEKPDHFYADPFLLDREGQTWLFYEDYSYKNHRGDICCAPVQDDLTLGPSVTCLSLPYHVSYPHVFPHDGEIFMIPESARNNSVDLYRATKFPFSWKLERTLFRGAAVDTTPVYHEGRWYFFTNLCEPPGNAVFGALFSSDRIDADWALHPASPVSTDVHTARSAGAIQRVDGRILRPVQDCSENYGRRIYIQEILQLTPDTYREQQLHSIEPNWVSGLRGVHTYGYSRGIEVLDAVTLRHSREVRSK